MTIDCTRSIEGRRSGKTLIFVFGKELSLAVQVI